MRKIEVIIDYDIEEVQSMELKVKENILAANDALAAANRQLLQKHGVTSLNILGSPGSGKTSLLERLLPRLNLASGVIEGDLATAKDAERIRAAGAPVVQINTNGGCHLDARMINQVLPGFDLAGLDLLFIENVGNLVCPAGFDLGETAKIVVLSVAEGLDKPAKYPSTFLKAAVVIINKIDLLPFCGFSLDDLHREIETVNPQAQIFACCSREGAEDGLDKLVNWLEKHIK
ncbi:MAG: hydrogenase nickel incorporation protein HypB [Clostridiales bacterium]|nr:hydrogenase nickel incorporation protein HypB [Clostridiales bacterium]